MITGFCRNCNREIHNDIQYYGYCSISCCTQLAKDFNISFKMAKDIDYRSIDRENLEYKISDLECDYDNIKYELNEVYGELADAEDEVGDLTRQNEKLKKLEWDKIQLERIKESNYNKKILKEMDETKKENTDVQIRNKELISDNKLLRDQNLELLTIIKSMREEYSRFELLDLGIELDYD